MEPADNRQLPSRLRAPGSGQACRKILGFALIPNCELKFGPVHNAPGTWLHKGVVPPPRPRPSRQPAHPQHPHKGGRRVGTAGDAGPHSGLRFLLPEPGAGAGLPLLLPRQSRRVPPRQCGGTGFIRKRGMASCPPSLLRTDPEEASLNYQQDLGSPQRVSSLGGVGRPVPLGSATSS